MWKIPLSEEPLKQNSTRETHCSCRQSYSECECNFPNDHLIGKCKRKFYV